MPPIDGLAEAAAVDQPRGDAPRRQVPERLPCSAAAWSASRWPRPGASLGAAGHAGRGGGPADRARGAVRGRAGRRRRSRERGVDVRSGRQGRRAVRARAAARSRVELEGGDAVAATSCWSRSAAARTPTTSGWRPSASRPRQADRGRRPACGRRPRLALRDRRRQRPRAAHPHGQVPGAVAADTILGQDGAADADGRALAAGDLHRPAGRRGRLHAGGGRGGGHRRARRRRRDRRRRAGASFHGRDDAPGTCRLVVDEDRRRGRRRHVRRARGRPSCCTRRRSRSSARCRSSGSPTPCPRLPDAQRGLAQPDGEARPVRRPVSARPGRRRARSTPPSGARRRCSTGSARSAPAG